MENNFHLLSLANRDSGDWLPDVTRCPKRAVPCGNPQCADEAMRAAAIRRSSPHNSDQALKHALTIAQNCTEDASPCPLALIFDVPFALNFLANALDLP